MITQKQWEAICREAYIIEQIGYPMQYLGQPIKCPFGGYGTFLRFVGNSYLTLHFPSDQPYDPSYWEVLKRMTYDDGQGKKDFTTIKDLWP